MGDVISFNSRSKNSLKENFDLEESLSGSAVCKICDHKWDFISPVGTVGLECPECHNFQGYPVAPVFIDEDHWQCNCGSQLFCITRNKIYCPLCGLSHKPFDE